MATQKPDYMTQAAWDYLLQFTIAHEALVLHMYKSAGEQVIKTRASVIQSDQSRRESQLLWPQALRRSDEQG